MMRIHLDWLDDKELEALHAQALDESQDAVLVALALEQARRAIARSQEALARLQRCLEGSKP